ncbi:MAG: hypothetical protein K2N05_03765 [Muribaculaceae bacterium]|nr:hypothetical protein [Muribaculaceae bacterium]
MNKFNLLLCGSLAMTLVACGSKNKGDESSADSVPTQTVDTVAAADLVPVDSILKEEDPQPDHSANERVIRKVYKNFVLGPSEGESSPKKYFTAKALKKLQAAYEYDCDQGPCYAFWDLGTGAQDGDGKSAVKSVTPIEGEDGWYRVEYTEMGHQGVTNIKIVDGKIDDYKLISANMKW